MPTILRIDGYRFFFYSDEGNEPPHVHISKGDGECKFWLLPVALARVQGVTPHEVRKIERLIFENHEIITSAYDSFHNP